MSLSINNNGNLTIIEPSLSGYCVKLRESVVRFTELNEEFDDDPLPGEFWIVEAFENSDFENHDLISPFSKVTCCAERPTATFYPEDNICFEIKFAE